MSYYKKFAKDIGLIGLVNILVALRGMILLPLITKNLGAEQYGIWTQFSITITLLAPLARLGLSYPLVRFLAAEKKKEAIQETVYSLLITATGAALIVDAFLLIFSQQLSVFFQLPIIYIIFLAGIVLFECLIGLMLGIFQAFQEIHVYSIFMGLLLLGEIGMIAASLLFGYGIQGAIVSLLIIRIIFFIVIFIFIAKRIGIRMPGFHDTNRHIKLGIPIVASNTSYLIVTSFDKYIIGFSLGALYVGYYSPAYSLGNLINFFILPLSFVLFPALSKLYDEHQTEQVKIFLKYSLKYFLAIAIPAAFGLSVLSKQLLIIFATPEIAQNGYFITPFVAFSIVLYGASCIFTEILNLYKKTKLSGTIWLAAAVINLLLNFLLIPTLGIIGGAISTFFVYFFSAILIWRYSFKLFKFIIDWKFIMKSFVSSILMAIAVVLVDPSGLSQTLLTVGLGFVVYCAFILLFRGFQKEEVALFRNLLKIKSS